MNIEEQILLPILEYYVSTDLNSLEKGIIKERIDTIRNMEIIIYPNDHNPPHFHVKSKDKSIDAKFSIEDCSYLRGTISNKDMKRIEAFFNDPKSQIVLKKVWNKYQETNL